MAMILSARLSTKRLSSSMTSSPSKSLKRKRTASSMNTVTTVISGLQKVENGSLNSRRVLVSSYQSHSSSAGLLVDKFQQDGTQDAMVFLRISLTKLTDVHSGHLSLLLMLSICLVSLILTNCTSTCILQKLVHVSVLVWVVSSLYEACSVIVVTVLKFRTIFFRRLSSIPLLDGSTCCSCLQVDRSKSQ